MKEMGRKL